MEENEYPRSGKGHRSSLSGAYPTYPPVEALLDCKYEWCGRTGAHGFKREDHLKEHYRKVHMKENEYPRSGKGHRSASKPHTTIPSPSSTKPLLDCKYEWCERTGAHGFKREDHRKKHYRKVHTNGEDTHFETGSGSAHAATTTNTKHAIENQETLVQAKANRDEFTVRNDGVSPSVIPQDSAMTIRPLPLIERLGMLNLHGKLPNEKGMGQDISVSKSCKAMLEASDANNDGMEQSPAHTLEDNDMEFPERNQAMETSEANDESCSDEGLILEHSGSSDLEPFGLRGVAEGVNDTNDYLIKPMIHNQMEDKLWAISSQSLKTLVASEACPYRASIQVQWDVLAFMDNQFLDEDFPNTALATVITISGSAQHAQATTCSDYIRQTWPANGSRILGAVQDALNSPSRTSETVVPICSKDDITLNHAELEFDVTKGRVCLEVKSRNSDFIVDVVQQLAWMGSALRTSANGQVQYCEAELAVTRVQPLFLDMTFETISPTEEDDSCWFPLFKNPVIARQFPTAHRSHHEVGLQIPLDLMAALGGARHAVDYEGGLVLKGYSTLFVPVGLHENSVQWHLICAKGEDRVSYHEASNYSSSRVLLSDLNHENLRNKLTYLGLWKEAETHLATADADYKSIDWSRAKEASSSLRLTGGTLGFSKIFTAQVNFALGAKDGSFHSSQQGPFQKTIDRAEKLPVVLYGQEDQRAWLVPALPVILHIIQLQHHIKPFIVDGRQVQIYSLDPSKKRNAAREAVAKNKSQKLYDRESKEEKEYCFRDAMFDNWSILDRLMESEATMQATPGVPVQSTWQTTLYGWEFRAIADEERHFKQKAQNLERTAGRWHELVKSVDAVVLFANGFGDIIKPTCDSAALCQKWRRLPKEKDYLAVCVSMLETFYTKAGHGKDHQYLTSAKLQWLQSSELFEPCVDAASNCCKCDRVQQVYHNSYEAFGHGAPPGRLEPDGCVVFGQVHNTLKATLKTLTTSKKSRLNAIIRDSTEIPFAPSSISGVPQYLPHSLSNFSNTLRQRSQ